MCHEPAVHMTGPISISIDERIEGSSIKHARESGEYRCMRGTTNDFLPLLAHLRNNQSTVYLDISKDNDSLIVKSANSVNDP